MRATLAVAIAVACVARIVPAVPGGQTERASRVQPAVLDRVEPRFVPAPFEARQALFGYRFFRLTPQGDTRA